MASYDLEIPTADGKATRSIYVEIDDITSTECPVSLLSRYPEAVELVKIYSQAQMVEDAGSLGTVKKWPGAMYDAWALLAREDSRDSYAREIAIHKA